MKSLKYIVALFLVAGLSTSCQKFLDTVPKDTLSPEFYYNNEKEMDAALAGVYDLLGKETYYGNYAFTFFSAASDISYWRRASGGNAFAGIQVLNYDAQDDNIAGLWKLCYTGINRANLVLANINKPQLTAEKRNQVKGEALFLRAYYHFLLVSNWGDVPLILDSKVDLSKLNVPRTPAKEVYLQIIKDMEEAEPLVKGIRELGYGGRVNKSAVRGVLARVNLYMAGQPVNDASRYAEAAKWALAVKNDAEAAHKLNPSFSDIFIKYAQDKYDIGESIWEVELWGNRIGNAYQEAGRVGNTNGIQFSGEEGIIGFSSGFIGATSLFYKMFESTDARRDWAIAPFQYKGKDITKVPWKPTEIYQRMDGKFRREYETLEKQKNYTPTNFPLLRYADVLLMLAEAENGRTDAQDPELKWTALNEVRKRAGVTLYTIAANNRPVGKDAFLKLIQDERARELSGEALRVNDLKRWGIYLTAMANLKTEILSNAPANYQYSALAATNILPKHTLFPVPLSEININSKLLPNNPGW